MSTSFEIERKFLVKKLDFSLCNYNKSEIVQSYISLFPTIRIRKSDNLYFLTIKGQGHLKKQEIEFNIEHNLYYKLLKLKISSIIEKTRYFMPIEHNLTAEIDVYKKDLDGLITIEVEFSSLDDALSFNPPSYFGIEVTNDKRFSNASLSTMNSNEIYSICKEVLK